MDKFKLHDKIANTKGYSLLEIIKGDKGIFQCNNFNYHKFERPLSVLRRTSEDVDSAKCQFCSKFYTHIIDAEKKCLSIGFEILNRNELISNKYGKIDPKIKFKIKSLNCGKNCEFKRQWSSLRDDEKPNNCSICNNDYRLNNNTPEELFYEFRNKVFDLHDGFLICNYRFEEKYIRGRIYEHGKNINKYWFKCNNKKHEPFQSVSESVIGKQKTWCRECSGYKKLTQKQAEAFYRSFNHTLESQYVNNLTKNKIICDSDEKHEYFRSYRDSSRKNRISAKLCPYCTGGKSIFEEITRKLLERMLNMKFHPSKPKWLIMKDGTRLDLDGFNKKHKIAFESDGAQHKLEDHHFNKISKKDFSDHIIRDKEKNRICKNNGVKLIRVYASNKDIDREDFIEFIHKQLIDECIKYNIQYKKDISYKIKIPKYEDIRKKLLIKFDATLNKNWKVPGISGSNNKFEITCNKCGFDKWKTSIQQLRDGYGCKKCAGVFLEIKDLNDRFKKYDFKILSKTYTNQKSKLDFQCTKCQTIIRNRVYTSLLRSLIKNKVRPCNFPKTNRLRDETKDCK